MSRVLYTYFAKPTSTQLGNFLRGLATRGISVSHFGKNDPPRKFLGTIDEAIALAVSGADSNNYTFARARDLKLDFDIQIHHDPRWTHSTVSASCPNDGVLRLVAESAAIAFELHIAVLGVSGPGTDPSWEVVYASERCPPDMRARFVKE